MAAVTEIRRATCLDVPAIVSMGAAFLASTTLGAHIATNPEAMETLTHRLLENGEAGDSVVFVADRGGHLDGMIGAVAYAHHISGERIAGEVFWWANPEARGTTGIRLLRRAEQWARDKGAKAFQMIAPAGADRVASIYQRLGYGQVETTYQREL